jgi:hypothetical protein
VQPPACIRSRPPSHNERESIAHRLLNWKIIVSAVKRLRKQKKPRPTIVLGVFAEWADVQRGCRCARARLYAIRQRSLHQPVAQIAPYVERAPHTHAAATAAATGYRRHDPPALPASAFSPRQWFAPTSGPGMFTPSSAGNRAECSRLRRSKQLHATSIMGGQVATWPSRITPGLLVVVG